MKKQTPASYPVAHVGLTQAFAAVEAVAEKMNRYAAAASTRPAELQALANAQTEAERQLAEADAQALSGECAADIAALEVAVREATAACARFGRQSDALDAMGAALITERDAALATLDAERAVYANTLRDNLAERILDTARDLAGHRAAYEALAPAATLNPAWLQLAHVSDPRDALLMGTPGAYYDRAPNLLMQTGPGTEAAVQAIRPALETLEAAKRLKRASLAPHRSASQPGGSH